MELNENLGSAFASPTGLNDSRKPQAQPAGVGIDSLNTDLSGAFKNRARTGAVSPDRIAQIAEEEGAADMLPVVMAIYGQETTSGKNAVTSKDGARGGMQMLPGTFARYARPGEFIDDSEDNMRAAIRYTKDLGTKFGNDPARIAAGYFSGEGNVNAGQGPAWKQDRADGNGKKVSSYVGDVLARLGISSAAAAEAPAPQASDPTKAPKWQEFSKTPEYTNLTPEQRAEVKSQYFQYWVAPHVGDQAQPLYQQFMQMPDGVPDRSWGEVATDTGVQLMEGVNTIVGAIPSLVAPEGGVAKFFDDNAKFWRDRQSVSLRTRMDNADKVISKAGEDGVVAQIATAAREYFTDPGLAARFVMTNLPSMVPGIGAAKLAEAAALARGATAVKAASVATTVAGGTNAVLNAGGARQEAFDDIKQTLIKQGMSPEQAEAQALKDSRVAAAVGGVAGYVSGKTGLEKAIVGKAGAGSAVRRGVGSALEELGGEQLEEVTPKLTTNALAGQYDDRSLGQDVGRTIVETAFGSAPGSVYSGYKEGRKPPENNQAPPAGGQQPPASPPAGSPATPPAGAPQPPQGAAPATPPPAAPVAPAGASGSPALSPEDDALVQQAELRIIELQSRATEEGLTPAEQAELNSLSDADGDPAALRQYYGLTQAPTQETRNEGEAQTQQGGASQPGPADEQAVGGRQDAAGVGSSAQGEAADGGSTRGPGYDGLPAEGAVNGPQTTQAQQAEAQGSQPGTEPVAPPKTEREAMERRRQTQILTPDGGRVNAVWDVVDADSVKASMKEGENQPRDRTRAASNAQVLEISRNPDFERLSDTSKTMDYGAPTLTKNGVIVGGNGRFEGISMAYDGQSGEQYRQALVAKARELGISSDQFAGMKKPVLVRRITDEADTRKLAIQSNQAAGLDPSDMEKAALDAERMKGLDKIEVTDTGDIPMTTQNMSAIRSALGNYSTNELGGFLTDEGGLSQSGLRRVKNAILYQAYGKTDALSRLIESPDADMKNVGTALMRASGRLAEMNRGIKEGRLPAEFNIAADLNAAIETLSNLRASGMSVSDFIAQNDMFGEGISPEAKQILVFLSDNLRSAKNITDFLNDYAQAILNAESAGGGLFGDVSLPSKSEALTNAGRKFEAQRAAAQSQQGLFDKPRSDTAAPAGEANRQQSEGQASTDAGNAEVSGKTEVAPPKTEKEAKARKKAAKQEEAPVNRDPGQFVHGAYVRSKSEPKYILRVTQDRSESPRGTTSIGNSIYQPEEDLSDDWEVIDRSEVPADRLTSIDAHYEFERRGIDAKKFRPGEKPYDFYVPGDIVTRHHSDGKENFVVLTRVTTVPHAHVNSKESHWKAKVVIRSLVNGKERTETVNGLHPAFYNISDEQRAAAAAAAQEVGPNGITPTEKPKTEKEAKARKAESKSEGEGADAKQTKAIGKEFANAAASSSEDGDFQMHHLFDAPEKGEVVRLEDKVKVHVAGQGWMTPKEAKAKIAEWKAHAAAQGKTGKNSDKIVLSLFDLTGEWSKPWEEAGYQVYRFDIQSGVQAEHNGEMINTDDINNFSTDYFNDFFGSFEGNDIHAILAACPCTDFASSGARHFAAKDADGRTIDSVNLVHMTLATIEYFKPATWAIENPVGRIEKLTGLPPWRLSFNPNHLGDPYTKKTLLWGRFNADIPVAPVEPTEGSKMHSQYGGKSQATKNARSVTPEGFAYSFFMANNAIDHPVMAIANKYDRLDRGLIQKAVDAGITEREISDAVDDHYYMDLDDNAANKAIQNLIDGKGQADQTGDLYDETATRPDTTDAQRELGRNAVEDLQRRLGVNQIGRGTSVGRGTASVLGSRLVANFRAGKPNSLVGRRVSNPADLAALSQVYRDPRFETFRVIYVDANGTILGEGGYTSRLPGAVALPNDIDAHVKSDSLRFGADGYYVLHNHPSGKSSPSPADINLTALLETNAPGFLGHAIIDHNEYSVIGNAGKTSTISAPELAGTDFFANPAVPHELLGGKIADPMTLAKVAKQIQNKDGYATLILTNTQNETQLLVDFPVEALSDQTADGFRKAKALIRRMARETGSSGHTFIVLPDGQDVKNFSSFLSQSIVADIVSSDGMSAASSSTTSAGRNFINRLGRPMRVEEPGYHGSPYRFHQFDLGEIGNGEGAQSYGWGIYTAGQKGTATWYRDRLSSNITATKDGKTLEGDGELAEAYYKPGRVIQIMGGWDRVISFQRGDNKSPWAWDSVTVQEIDPKTGEPRGGVYGRHRRHHTFPDARELEKVLKDEGYEIKRGHLYSFEVPDDAIEKMLRWDEPMSAQPDTVKQSILKSMERDAEDGEPASWRNMTGKQFYKELSEREGSDQAASEYLRDLGIPGLRYLDGSSRSKGEGAYNTVIWDQDLLDRISDTFSVEEQRAQYGSNTIEVDGVQRPALNSNGKPIYPTEEGVRNFWRWFGDSKVVDAEGRPLVVYHGTAYSQIFKFQGYRGVAGHFAFDSQIANEWANAGHENEQEILASGEEDLGDGGQVYPVYLRAENIFDISNSEHRKQAGIDRVSRDAVYETLEGNLEGIKAAGFDSYYDYEGSLEDGRSGIAVFDNTQIKSATGNNGNFEVGNPNIVRAPQTPYTPTPRGQTQQQPANGPAQQGLPGVQPPAPPAMPPRQGALNAPGAQPGSAWNVTQPGRGDNFIYSWVDKQIDLKRVTQAISQTRNIIDSFNAYQREELYHGRVAQRTTKFLERELRPLLQDMKLKGISQDEFEAFLWARHAQERNAQIASINPQFPDGGSGLTNAQAADYMAGRDVFDQNGDLIIKGMKLADRNRLDQLAARVDAINAGTKQVLIQYGLETPATIANWDATYKHYVPLHREDMDNVTPIGQGFSVKGSASKRALGSGRGVVDILAHLALQREAALTRGEKNRVAVAVYGLARQNPNQSYWEADKVPMIQTIDKSTGLVTSVPDPNYKNRDNVLVARIGGKDRAIVFNTRDERAMRMVAALKNLDTEQLGLILGTVGKFTRWIAAVNTQYNPVFGFINGARDAQAASLNLSSTPLRGKQAQVLKNLPAAMRAIWNIERGGTGGAWGPVYEQLLSGGGTTGYREIFRIGKDRAKMIQKEIDDLNAGRSKRAIKSILTLLDHFNTAIENGTRMAAYKVALDNGLSVDKSASIAKNITVNFNRKGVNSTQANTLYAFFNAGVQGSARIAQTLSGPTGKTIMTGGVLLGIIQAIIGHMAFDDDEWDDIPAFLKSKNLIIPTGDKGYLQWPMPLGFNVFPNIGRIVAEMAIHGGKKAGEKTGDLIMAILDSVSPVGNGTPLQTISPTITDIPAALAENKDSTGRDIARTNVNPLAPTPGFTRAKDSSSTASRLLAKGINWATGGTKYTPGWASPTPDHLDYVFGQLTGGVGRETNKIYQSAELKLRGEDVPEYKKPFIGRFYGRTDEDVASTTRFWNNIKELNGLELEIKGRRKEGLETGTFIEKNPESAMIKYSNTVERDVSEMRSKRHKIEFDERMEEADRTERLKALDDQILEKMRAFNERVAAERKSIIQQAREK